MKWKEFGELCQVKVPSLRIRSRNDNKERVEMKRRAIATCLHHIGEVVYFDELGFLILDCEWFCGEALEGRGKPWKWQLSMQDCVYAGCHLECDDSSHMFLTPGFFSGLQFDGHFTITRRKYEFGPSVNYRDGGNRSLRAKDDSTTNEPGDGNCDEGDAQDDETVTPDEIGDGENADELTLDKDATYSHCIGFKPDVLDQTSYTNMDLDVHKDATLMEDGELNEQVQLAQNRNEGNQHEETALLMKLWKRQIQKLT
ncbi:hypothetical protein JHK85_007394 [Glycine max]|nr:hypothetical protein JHK85_007394 [Glycine max]KAG5071972.1 hypothetical protein JHK86_007183 [Glycine max]